MQRPRLLKPRNDCAHYHHKKGYPRPGSRDSCRGCIYNEFPSLYDGGCIRPHDDLSVTNPVEKGLPV